MEVVNHAKYNGRWDYELVGKGKVKIFQDGRVINGTWKKPSKYSMIRFVDKDGHPIELNPGQTWITAVDVGDPVTYKP